MSPAWLKAMTDGAVKQQIDLSPRSARLSRSLTVRGRWLIQTLSSLSTKMPPICPRIQLFGSGLGHVGSISNFGVAGGPEGARGADGPGPERAKRVEGSAAI